MKHIDLSTIPGEVLGGGYPDWPEGLGTFAERRAYQMGVAHARAVGLVADPVQAERERCAAIAEDEARIREKAGKQHPEESPARGRCFAAARAAMNVARGIRNGEVVAGTPEPHPLSLEAEVRRAGGAPVFHLRSHGDVTPEELKRIAGVGEVGAEQDRLDAERYRYLKANCISTHGSGGKFDLPKWGMLEFHWHRVDYRDGKPYVRMELDQAVDEARSAAGVGGA